MDDSEKTIYRIRDEAGHVMGEYSHEEVLTRIENGKLSGDEEVQIVPHNLGASDKWHKLSSLPEYYDLFLKRIFPKELGFAEEAPPGEAGEGPGAEADDVDRENTKEPFLAEASEPSVKEENHEEIRDAGKTIHEEVIDELFRDAEPSLKSKTLVVPAEKPDEAPSEFTTPIPTPPEAPSEFAAHFAEEKKHTRKRRQIFAVLGLMLALLYFLGRSPSEKEDSGMGRSLTNKASSTPTTLSGSKKEEHLKALLEEGDGLYNNDTPLSYSAALDVYKEAAAYNESSAIIIARMGETSVRMLPNSRDKDGLKDEIKRLLERGRAIDPQFSSYYRIEALLKFEEGKLNEALALAQNAVETDGNSYENYLVLGELQSANGDSEKARNSLGQAIKMFPGSARAHLLLGLENLKVKDYPHAKEETNEALKYSPIYPEAYLLFADVLAVNGDASEALSVYDTGARLAKFGPPSIVAKIYLRLGLAKEAQGDQKAAETNYKLAYHYDRKIDGLDDKTKKLSLSRDELNRLAAEREYDKDYFMSQGDSLAGEGKLVEGSKFYQAATILDRNDGKALVKLGEISEKLVANYDDFLKIENIYQRAIDRDPSYARAYVKLGTLATDQYNFEDGYKLLTQAVALAPNDAEPLVALGKHFYKRQDYNEAISKLSAAAQVNPNDPEVNYYAGLLRLLYKKDSIRDAQQYFLRAYTADPQHYLALSEWLKLKVASFEKNFAIKFVKNLMDKDKSNPNLYWVMGEVYAANKEYRRAIAFYHESLDLDNHGPRVRFSLAEAHEAVGELDKAVAEYRLSSLLDRRNPEGLYRASELLLQLKKFGECEEVLKFLINITPNYPGAHRMLSRVYQAKKQKDEAIAMMSKEVETNPQNARFRVEYGELLMEYEKYDDALKELAEVANLPSLTKAPEYVYDKLKAYLLMSRSYRALNKPESAEGMVKLGLEIDPKDPELHRELGFIYYMLQRDKEGVKELEYYLSRYPAAKDEKNIRELISKMQIEE